MVAGLDQLEKFHQVRFHYHMLQKRGIVQFGPVAVNEFLLHMRVIAENVFHGIGYIVSVDVVDFIFVHLRTAKLCQQMIVIGPVGLAGIEEDPVAVKNNEFQHLANVQIG